MSQNKNNIATGKLGTFAGVFTPSILTILGIILFLRLGYVVGSAGLGRALIIICIANAISILTSFSLAAIATNLKVKGGGDYYLISRTLGLEFGGAIGMVLFLAQSISIAFYCLGFGEAVSALIPDAPHLLPQSIAAFATAFLFIFAWLGADWATRFQYVVMAFLILALLSFMIGGIVNWDTSKLINNWSAPSTGPGFWILFAIFFPAVTGFTQGVSMSGDLKDPGKSLPTGTFMAVGISILVYFGSAILFAGALTGDTLTTDYNAMNKISLFGFLINAGVIAATLSSAMASFLGAPRILQSLAGDRIFPFLVPFAKGYGPGENPRRGVLLTAVIAFVTIGLGNLNLIAPVVTMFFLISYGLMNYAVYFEARAASPSFRPSFRLFDFRLSLLGFLTCLGAMLAIDLMAGLVSVSLLFAIYHYIKQTAGPARWADSRRSYYLQRVRENLIAAAAETEHPRDWRPQLLAFSNDSSRRKHLLTFASWMAGNSGLTTAVHILEGEGVRMLKLRQEAEDQLRKDILDNGLKAFSLAVASSDLTSGVYSLIQAFGIGPIRVNTILLNWLDPIHKDVLGLGEQIFAENIRVAFRFGCNIVILKANDNDWNNINTLETEDRTIDIWWQDNATSRLMLLLAYLISKNEPWEHSGLRVLARKQEESENTLEALRTFLDDVRIPAEPVIVDKMDMNTIVAQSNKSSFVFLPFRLKGKHMIGPVGEPLDALLSGLPMTAMVLAAKDIDLDAEPEEGKAGEMAEALDTLSDAEKKAEAAEKEVEKLSREAEKKARELETSIVSAADENLMEKVKAVTDVKEKTDKAVRKKAKAQTKAEDAAKKVESLGIAPIKKEKEPGGEIE